MNQIAHIEGSLFTNAIWGGQPSLNKARKRSCKPLSLPREVNYAHAVTVFPNVYNTDLPKYLPIEDIVIRIKNGNSKDLVTRIRNGESALKLKLPCICFSGIFSQRCNDGLIRESGLICLDYDNVPDVEAFKKRICENEYTIVCFISPSGNGLKVICKTEDIDKFPIEYLDLHTDISRVCFESYDPDVYHNPNSLRYATK